MKLHVSRTRKPANLPVLEKVLEEFETEKTLELVHDSGADFLVWNETLEDRSRSISVAIPESWLDDSSDAPKLEATTRNFAAHVATF